MVEYNLTGSDCSGLRKTSCFAEQARLKGLYIVPFFKKKNTFSVPLKPLKIRINRGYSMFFSWIPYLSHSYGRTLHIYDEYFSKSQKYLSILPHLWNKYGIHKNTLNVLFITLPTADGITDILSRHCTLVIGAWWASKSSTL